MNQHAKYLGQISFTLKVLDTWHIHTRRVESFKFTCTSNYLRYCGDML